MNARTEPPPRLRTFRDIIDALPSHMTGQVIGGRLVVMPRPAPPHINATGALRELLGGPFQRGLGGPGGWWIQQEPELEPGLDPDFEPIVVSGRGGQDFAIEGLAVGLIRNNMML